MKTKDLVVPLHDGGPAEVVGYATCIDNLWVHRDIVKQDEPWVRTRGGYWTVTHEPTGCAVVMGLKTRAAALVFAESLVAGDWSFTEVKFMPEETRRVGNAAVAAIKGELYG